ncbi:MAG: glycosyl transferase family 4 [Lysobacterales bacterium]
MLAALLAAAPAWMLTRLALAYAQGAAMHDQPGARRMHSAPTVRGAGLGFVLVITAVWTGLGLALGVQHPLGRWALGGAAGLAIVALISWLDDRQGLPVWPRLLAHATAAVLLTLGAWPGLAAQLPWVLVLILPLILIIPAINFWNFMDGIHGMAAVQAVLVATIIAALAWKAGDYPAAWFAAVVAGSVCAFLPFNFPDARAFMGDVGSASLGYIVAALALMPLVDAGPVLPAALLLAAAVFLDTGLTLAWRMLRRPPRRWYTAHREHLYQWLTRAGWSHTRTTLSYLGFSVGISALVLLIGPLRPLPMLIAAAVVYLSGALLWRLARDYALRRARVGS